MLEETKIPDRLAAQHVLILENVAAEAESLRNQCRLSFETSTEIKIILGDSADIVRQFDEFHKSFGHGSIVFLDICLERDPKVCSGRNVAQHIRCTRPDMPILIYTQRGDVMTCFDLLEGGIADYMVQKPEIGRGKMTPLHFNASVCRAIQRHSERTCPKTILKPSSEDEAHTEEDWLVVELLSEIGPSEVKRLLPKCVKGAKAATLGYMSPGLSGAVVFRAAVDRDDASSLDVVIKFSRCVRSLEMDFQHVVDLGSLQPGRLLPHLRGEGIQAGREGWYAYAMETMPGQPLSRILRPGANMGLFKKVLDEARNFYTHQTPQATDLHKVDLLTKEERISSLVQLKTLRPLVQRHHPDDAIDDQEVSSSIRKRTLPGKSFDTICSTLGQLPGIMQHGDLHPHNILVDGTTPDQISVCLIDWARYGLYPLGSDLAKLESQLRLLLIGADDCSHYTFDSLGAWGQTDATMHHDTEHLTVGDEVLEPTFWNQCLRDIREEAQHQILRGETANHHRLLTWWYYFALYQNYLQGIGLAHLPAPKRVWAYRTAAHLGRLLADSL